MTELKTLKDIETCCTFHSVEEETFKCKFAESNLKAEAIKWVKFLETSVNTKRSDVCWIKDFFNITEDDLKVTGDLK